MNRPPTQNRPTAKRAVVALVAAPLMLTMLATSPAFAADRAPMTPAVDIRVDDAGGETTGERLRPAGLGAQETVALRADEAQVEAAVERLRAAGMWSEEPAGIRAENGVPTSLAKDFGGKLLSSSFNQGANWALSEVLSGLGLGSESDALDKIGLSITALQGDVTRMMQMMHQLLHGQDKTNFYNSYTQAGLAASRIDTAMRSVGDWVKYDLQPSEKNVADMATVVNLSMGELAFMATNQFTGTIPLMMKATEAANVTDFDWDYYEQIDEVRDSYRTTYAQGLATMDMLVTWDRDGTISTTRARLVDDAVANTLKAYQQGIQLDISTPTNAPVVHGRNTDRMLSAWKTPDVVDGNGWVRNAKMMKGEMEPVLRAMAEGYNPAQHGGVSLQKYLEDRNIPTSYVYYDTFHNHKETGSGSLTRYISYELRARVGKIQGNEYKEDDLKVTKNARAVRQDWVPFKWVTDKESEKAADAWYKTVESHWKSQATQMSKVWTDTYHASSRLLVKPVQNNAGGWATDFHQQRVQKAAFPDA